MNIIIPKVACKCGCTSWALFDGKHECRNCPNIISDEVMLEKINELMAKRKELKSAG
jgi:hypothetical protein